MFASRNRSRAWFAPSWLGILVLVLVGVAVACSGKASTGSDLQVAQSRPDVSVASPSAQEQAASQAPQTTAAVVQAQTAAKAQLKLLKIQPDTGTVGASFTITGEGLPPGQSAELMWATWDGRYETNVMAETIEYVAIRYTDRREPLGTVTTDAQGNFKADFKAPFDYGGVHDVYVVIEGQDVARGGFQIKRAISVSPSEGPVGTPIVITVTGMGKPPVEHMLSVRYDNQYAGYISGVTTRGSATAYVRAAGPAGVHAIEFSGAGNHGGGYLNNQQSPYAGLFPADGAFRFTFNVTADDGAPVASTEWPEPGRVAQLAHDAPRTTASNVSLRSGVTPSLNPFSGAILSSATVAAAGLRPGTEVELFWKTAKGNRVTAAGWDLVGTPLGKATSADDGTLRADIRTPDGLGGWHTVDLVQDEAVVAQVPFYVQQSLTGVTPTRVKAGEKFAIQLKGIGWTELDNTVAVTYDNSYLGYACGFNSNGTIILNITATGAPGTHLIDIYPTTFQGKATGRWGFQMPQLNAIEDHPGLDLGYNLPIYRLAIEVVE